VNVPQNDKEEAKNDKEEAKNDNYDV